VVLLTVSMGTLVATLDVSVLTVCLPALATIFKADAATIAWVNVAYLVTSQSLMFTVTRLGDAIGRKRIYLLAFTLYTGGLILCALSPSVVDLALSRALQGAGAAGVLSLSTAIGVAVFPRERQGTAVGVLASAGALGLVAGPIMGGTVLDLLGWQSIFLLRVPIGLIGIFAAWALVREQARDPSGFRFDVAGSLCLFGCLTSGLLFLSMSGRCISASPGSVLLVLTFVLLALFIHFERRADQPVIDLSLFGNAVLAGAAVTGMVHAVVLAGSIFLLPFYLVDALRLSASRVGLLFALLAIPFLFLSPLSGRAADRIGHKFLSALGIALSCIALLWLSRLGRNPPAAAVVLSIALLGVSYGVFIPPNNSAIMKSVPSGRLGTASGIIATTRQIGSSAGIAFLSGLYASRLAVYAGCPGAECAVGIADKTAVVRAFQDILTVAAAFGLIGIVTAFIPLRVKAAGGGKDGDRLVS
jgi:EmrB/QacA subfamily drug resistance transporter